MVNERAYRDIEKLCGELGVEELVRIVSRVIRIEAEVVDLADNNPSRAVRTFRVVAITSALRGTRRSRAKRLAIPSSSRSPRSDPFPPRGAEPKRFGSSGALDTRARRETRLKSS
jgi:hypothetical protein